ncbi:MAG: hypothetical protein ACXWEF_06805 [Solirubrobacterales bacterium]
MADREDRIEEQLRRGNELMAEVREEHRLNRISYEQQLDLTRTVVRRNGEAFVGMMDALARFGDRIDTFGATLNLQREILLRFLDRLDEGERPQG